MNRRDLIWPGICFALPGAPLAVALIIAPPEAPDLPRALWETVLLSGAGLLSGYAILRLTPRRWVRVVGVLTVPVGLVLYAMLDSEGASVLLAQAMAPEGKRLRSIVYPDNPLRTAISWFFLHVPLARSLVVLVIPALVAVVVFGLQSVRQRGSRSSALPRNRRQAIEGLMARFHLDHADWIVDEISTPKQALVAQIPIVLAGLYFDIVENRKLSISRPRFFQLVRDSLEGVEGIWSSTSVFPRPWPPQERAAYPPLLG